MLLITHIYDWFWNIEEHKGSMEYHVKKAAKCQTISKTELNLFSLEIIFTSKNFTNKTEAEQTVRLNSY